MARSIRSARGAAPGPRGGRHRRRAGHRPRASRCAYAREGATVVISSRTQSDLDAVVAAHRRRGRRRPALAVVADASDRTTPDGPVQEAIERFGGVDVLVNNVGGSVGRHHDPFTGDDESFERHAHAQPHVGVVDDPRGAARHARAAVRAASSASARARRSAPPASLSYTTAKHGLVGFTKQLAQTVGTARHHRQPAVPRVDQHLVARLRSGGAPRGDHGRRGGRVGVADNAQHRVLEPEELTGMATLLASDDGAGITGQVITVDGGYRL